MLKRDPKNVQKAVTHYGLTYSAVQHNNKDTWRAYKNKCWLAKHLIDAGRFIRYTHFREGSHEETEEVISEFFNQKSKDANSGVLSELIGFLKIETRETYAGTSLRKNKENKGRVFCGGQWSTSDNWDYSKEHVEFQGLLACFDINLSSPKASLVSDGERVVDIFVDGDFYKTMQINETDLYRMHESGIHKEHDISAIFKERE